MLKTVVVLKIFVEVVTFFPSKIFDWKKKIFCISVSLDCHFDQFRASLLNMNN